MEFRIATDGVIPLHDEEISGLLTQVYVEAGYTTPEEALQLFAPAAVRERGTLIGARDHASQGLAGMVIVVPPDSPARRLAQAGEAEIHLLGVLPAYRGQGLGKQLMETAIRVAKEQRYSKLLLWTQLSMTAAQGLYERLGFLYVGEMHRNGRAFKLYELPLRAH